MKHVMIVLALLATLVLQTSMAYGAMQPPTLLPSPPPPGSPESSESSGPPPSGTIDETIANRLTIGMSDAELFVIAGPPKFPVRELNFASNWVYAIGDSDDLLKVTFAAGRVVEMKRFRP